MKTSEHIRTLVIRYDEPISQHEVNMFRGACLNAMNYDAEILFHNHTDDGGYRYSYPLIQYKRIQGNAAIVAIDEGADIVGEFLANAPKVLRLGDRKMVLNTESIVPSRILMQTWEHEFQYSIHQWLPLNSENYKQYSNTLALSERVKLLESILTGNLLSMCKGLGIHLEKELYVTLLEVKGTNLTTYKGVRRMAFNIEFTTNLSIPNYLGIGKSAALGYGIVREIRERKQ